jgi:hypothetical protein
MMEKPKLRGADVITSVILILFGGWVLWQAFRMPMKDSYGGVMNVWYVSPALLPIIIGAGIIALAVSILVHALKEGGAAVLREMLRNLGSRGWDSTVRFAAILVPLISLVFMNLQRIDFFLCIMLFLYFMISVFYLDDMRVLRRALVFYTAEMVLLLLLFVFGLDARLNALFRYSVDVLALVLFVALVFFVRLQAGRDPVRRRMLRQTMLVTVLAPLVLVPVFRFLLRVPLPKEGGIVNLMSLLVYTLRKLGG